MQSFRVVLGMYNSLPYNASDTLYEQAYQGAWRPFLSGLYKFPSIKAVIHFPGNIFAWIEQNHPEYLYLLIEMVRKGQIELLGGGFYSPLAPLVSTQDMTGQVEALSAFIRKTIGKRPSGAWLYEYSWTSSLPAILQNSKIQYTFLPAAQFKEIAPENLSCQPVASEDHRKMVLIYPAFESHSDDSAFVPYEATLLKLQQDNPQISAFVIMADGNAISSTWERSGLESPDVLFERSFAWFQKNCLEYDTITASQLYKSSKAARTIYFAQCYSRRFRDYCERIIRKADIPRFECVQISKQSVVDHPLVHLLYQKLNFVSAMTNLFRGDKSRKKASLDDIWRAQSGELFWVSPTGGILRSEARLGAYASLIEAEKTIRQNRFHHFMAYDDLDFDGIKEVLYQSSVYNCYLKSDSASVAELDSLRTGRNYACGWNAEHFSTGCFKDEIRAAGTFETRLFPDYEAWNLVENAKESLNATFYREFHGKIDNLGAFFGCRKSYQFENDYFSINYELTNKGSNPFPIRFCTISEIIALPSLKDHKVQTLAHRQSRQLPADQSFAADAIDGVEIGDVLGAEKMIIRSDNPFSLNGVPNFAESPKDGRFITEKEAQDARIFEGFTLTIGWDFSLPPEGTVLFSVSVHIEH
ncbi:MAG TPA: hypothetical protein DHU26_02830 [Spirochaetaceae bacterium]|nr:hypothetical protein [Spirochaetaceae bacterium]